MNDRYRVEHDSLGGIEVPADALWGAQTERTATAEQRLENGEWIQPAGEERLTLVSCWPRDDNSHRIIVIAHPVTTN